MGKEETISDSESTYSLSTFLTTFFFVWFHYNEYSFLLMVVGQGFKKMYLDLGEMHFAGDRQHLTKNRVPVILLCGR